MVNATPRRVTSGKETRYPFYRRLCGPQGRGGRVQKISPPPGFDTLPVHPVASRYTDPLFLNILRQITIHISKLILVGHRIELGVTIQDSR